MSIFPSHVQLHQKQKGHAVPYVSLVFPIWAVSLSTGGAGSLPQEATRGGEQTSESFREIQVAVVPTEFEYKQLFQL